MRLVLKKELILENLKEMAMNTAKNGGTVGATLYDNFRTSHGMDHDANKISSEKNQFDNDINKRSSEQRLEEKSRRQEMKSKGFELTT